LTKKTDLMQKVQGLEQTLKQLREQEGEVGLSQINEENNKLLDINIKLTKELKSASKKAMHLNKVNQEVRMAGTASSSAVKATVASS
jgi:hypothetical protein